MYLLSKESWLSTQEIGAPDRARCPHYQPCLSVETSSKWVLGKKCLGEMNKHSKLSFQRNPSASEPTDCTISKRHPDPATETPAWNQPTTVHIFSLNHVSQREPFVSLRMFINWLVCLFFRYSLSCTPTCHRAELNKSSFPETFTVFVCISPNNTE